MDFTKGVTMRAILNFSLIFLIILMVGTQAKIEIPQLFEPANDTHLGEDSEPPTFRWSKIQNVIGYEIEFGISEEFKEDESITIATKTNYYDLKVLIPSVEQWKELEFFIYWRVRAIGKNHQLSQWSEIYYLTKTKLKAPHLYNPVNRARFRREDPIPEFQWEDLGEDNINGYIFQIGITKDFTEENSTKISTNHPFLFLNDYIDKEDWEILNIALYWRVCGINKNGIEGPWSQIWKLSKSTYAKLTNLFPGDQTHLGPEEPPPILFWDGDINTIGYEIQFGNNYQFDEIYATIELDEPRFDFNKYITYEDWQWVGFTFYWRVSAIYKNEVDGPWSDAVMFSKAGKNIIVTYGDSITDGKCVDNGYVNFLAPLLNDLFDRFVILNYGIPGAKSLDGEENMLKMLEEAVPNYILIMFGTNDSVDRGNCDPPFDCRVDEHLTNMVNMAREWRAIPIISTIIPVNPEGKYAGAQPFIDFWNQKILQLPQILNITVVDNAQAFYDYGNLPELFCDWGHPNDLGYQIMAQTFYDGLWQVAH